MGQWNNLLTLDANRQIQTGDTTTLCNAIRAGADMRVGTGFRYREHVDTTSSNNELIREVMDFRILYLLDDRWVAGIQNLRVPISLPAGFGPRESMSFFLYNQDGHQAIARPYLDGQISKGQFGISTINEFADMPKYHELESFDAETNAPSSNFIYDFDYYQFMVRSNWNEVFAHDAKGQVITGNLKDLAEAFADGAEVKIAISGLCDDLLSRSEPSLGHEVFVHLGACYFHTEQKLFIGSANPVVRTRPGIPLGYTSQGWDFGWLMPRSDGYVARWLCDPYTLKFRRDVQHYPIRWFVSD